MTTDTDTGERRQTHLNQIVAVVAGIKERTKRVLTEAHRASGQPQPFVGINRTYQPLREDGVQQPSEKVLVQKRVQDDLIDPVRTALERMLNVVATQEWANTTARADLVVEHQTLLNDVPVTYLMWLEKQVHDLRTFIKALPVLDVAQDWTYDEDMRAWRTDVKQTFSSKKVMRNHVLAEATDRHPAQVQVYNEDEPVGVWSTVHTSGALPASRVFEMTRRVDQLLDGIRLARERANMQTVKDVQAATTILDYVFRVNQPPTDSQHGTAG